MAWKSDWTTSAISDGRPHGGYERSDKRLSVMRAHLERARKAEEARRNPARYGVLPTSPTFEGDLAAAAPPLGLRDVMDTIGQVEALISESHDLRGLAGLVRLYALAGDLPSAAGCLAATVRLASESWPQIHPSPADPTDRLEAKCEALAELADPQKLVWAVEQTRLAWLSGRSAHVLADLKRSPSSTLLDALKAAGPDKAGPCHGALLAIAEALRALQVAVEVAVRADPVADKHWRVPNFTASAEEIDKLAAALARGAGISGAEDSEADEGDGPASKERAPSSIRNRGGVFVALDAVLAFYRDAEPGSPTPVLVARARQLVGTSFQQAVLSLSSSSELPSLARDVAPPSPVERQDVSPVSGRPSPDDLDAIRQVAQRLIEAPDADVLAGLASALLEIVGRLEGPAPAGVSPDATVEAPPVLPVVTSREDVALVIDDVVAYFEDFEPSSPAPLLLRKAKGLVGKDFWATVREMTPRQGVEIEKVLGLVVENNA